MAFNPQYLTLVGPDGNSEAGRNWRYKTEDTILTVDTVDYFLLAIGLLSLTDKIDVIVVTNIGLSNEALADAGSVLINAHDKSTPTIDTTNETAFVTADTD